MDWENKIKEIVRKAISKSAKENNVPCSDVQILIGCVPDNDFELIYRVLIDYTPLPKIFTYGELTGKFIDIFNTEYHFDTYIRKQFREKRELNKAENPAILIISEDDEMNKLQLYLYDYDIITKKSKPIEEIDYQKLISQ